MLCCYLLFQTEHYTVSNMTDIIRGPVKRDMSSYSKINDIQMDSLTCLRVEQTQRDEEVFRNQLVHVDEQMGTDDLELLKFVCRDVIGGKLNILIDWVIVPN